MPPRFFLVKRKPRRSWLMGIFAQPCRPKFTQAAFMLKCNISLLYIGLIMRTISSDRLGEMRTTGREGFQKRTYLMVAS